MKPSWTNWVGLKSNGKCPQTHTEGHPEERVMGRTEGHAHTDTESGEMLPQARERLEAESTKELSGTEKKSIRQEQSQRGAEK